jgi:hypothetical protein
VPTTGPTKPRTHRTPHETTHPKNPRSQKPTTPRPCDRVTDNRDTFRRKLARLRDLKRVAPSHITEPDTDARVIA